MTATRLACVAALASMLSACSGNGAPSNGDVKAAMEEGIRYLLRNEYGSGKGEVIFSDVAVKDCISQGEHWVCHAEGTMEMKVPRNGETTSYTKKFSGDAKLSKTDNGWVIDDYPMSFRY